MKSLILWTNSTDLRYMFMGSLGEVSLRGVLDSWRELFEERGGITERHVARGGTVFIIVGQAATYSISTELIHEWPEVVAISMKLVCEGKLDERDKVWIRELAVASGWNVDDIVEELKNLDVDPSERVERYRALFEGYYREALEHKERMDTKQAGEKIWGRNS